MKSFSTVSFAVCEVWTHQHEAHWLLNNHKNFKLEKGKKKRFWSENAIRWYILAVYFLSVHSFY